MKFIDYHHLEVFQKPVMGDKQVKFPSEYSHTFSIAPRAAESRHVAYPVVVMSLRPGTIQRRKRTKLVKITDARSLIPLEVYKDGASWVQRFRKHTLSLFFWRISVIGEYLDSV